MKINNFSSNFRARSPRIRKADKIVRNVNNNFPMFSNTYAGRRWVLFNSGPENFYRYYDKLEEVRKNIVQMRAYVDELSKDDKYILGLFDIIKNKKSGNCDEGSWITLGALCANGFIASQRASVGIEIKVIDKRAGNVVHRYLDGYDHTMLLASMGKDIKKIEEYVVIDPWLNKAMSYSEAKETYISMLKDWYLDNKINDAKNEFIDKMREDYAILGKKLPVDFDIDNYSFEPHIVFVRYDYDHDINGEDEANEFGDLVREKYPELIINRLR